MNERYDSEKKYFTRLFKRAKRQKKYVRLSDSLFNVDTVEHNEGGCGQCGLRYDCIQVSGYILTNNAKVWDFYSANVSAFYIIECLCDGENMKTDATGELLFRGFIERDQNYLYDRFLNRRDTELIKRRMVYRGNALLKAERKRKDKNKR